MENRKIKKIKTKHKIKKCVQLAANQRDVTNWRPTQHSITTKIKQNIKPAFTNTQA